MKLTQISTSNSEEEDSEDDEGANDTSDYSNKDPSAENGGEPEGREEDEDSVIELTDSEDDKDFTDAHAKLAAQGIIDLTGDLD